LIISKLSKLAKLVALKLKGLPQNGLS